MTEKIETFAKRRSLGDKKSLLGVLRLVDPETPAVRLDTINISHPHDGNVDERSNALRINRSLEERQRRVKQTNEFQGIIEMIKRHTGLEFETVPALLEYVSNSHKAVVNPTLDVFLYHPEHSDGFGVSLEMLRELEMQALDAVQSDLTHTDSSIELYKEYHEEYGKGLGIPRCEREWFAECYEDLIYTGLDHVETRNVEDSKQFGAELIAKSPEHRSAKAAMDRFVWDVLTHHILSSRGPDLAALIKDPPEVFFSRPTTGFYPHTPDCSEAIRIGKRVEDAVRDDEVKNLYRIEVVYNNLKGLMIEYKRYREGFDLETNRFFETLDRKFEDDNAISASLEELADSDTDHRLYDYLVEQYVRS